MRTQPETVCRACGMVAPARGLCDDCAPAGDLLAADVETRLAALAVATEADRPRVLLAALRGGRLWSGQGPGGVDLGRTLLNHLLWTGGTRLYARYLAEDAVVGSLAYATLSRHDASRAILRMPAWLAAGRAPGGPAELMRGWWARPDRLAAAGFRLGSVGMSPSELDAAIGGAPAHMRMWMRLAARLAARRPSASSWMPSHADLVRAAGWRRWPLGRFEPGGVACCTDCGEVLPQSGPCTFCGVDPDQADGPTILPLQELLSHRDECPICGIDRCSAVVPVRCPGCLQPISYGEAAG